MKNKDKVELITIERDAEDDEFKSYPSKEMTLTSLKIVAGSCNLHMRLLPTNQVNSLTAENFETYNPISGSTEEGDIKTNVLMGDTITKTFVLKPRPVDGTTAQSYVSLVEPYDSESLCVKLGDMSMIIPIKGYYQRSDSNEGDNELTLDYSISSSKYVIGDAGRGNPKINIREFNVQRDVAMPDVMKTYFDTQGNRDELTFTYTFKDIDKEVKKGSFKFYMSSSSNCVPGKMAPETQGAGAGQDSDS